jgi:glutathione synthase/RimK-type ligase-like ATP-grasp enzyme
MYDVPDRVDCFFVTYDGLPDLDPHDRLVVTELAVRGVVVEPAVWTDASIDWGAARLCVVRSTWDYHAKHADFLRWLREVESKSAVRNHPAVIRWNSHKFYLRDLQKAGVPIVPTHWLNRGAATALEGIRSERGWSELIIKPAHGASSTDVLHVRASVEEVKRGQLHLERLLRDQDVLVQPFLTTLTHYPERALVFVDGAFTHAVEKTPYQKALPSGEAGPAPLVEATAQEIEVAMRAMETAAEPPLFCRVDLVRDERDAICVLELELIEPTLFLGEHAPAVGALADAVVRLLHA